MPHTVASQFAAWRRPAPSGRAPLVAVGFGPRTATPGSRCVPRHGFCGAICAAPSERADVARPLPVDGCGVACRRRQGPPTHTPADRIGLGHHGRDPQRGGAEAGYRAVPDSSGPHPRGPARRRRLFPSGCGAAGISIFSVCRNPGAAQEHRRAPGRLARGAPRCIRWIWCWRGGADPISRNFPPNLGCRWLGEVSDERLAQLLAGALAFVYPSFYEGFGLPVLEAMQCGTCVIASRDPAIGEVAAGAALEAGSHAELVRAMLDIAAHPERAGAMARARVAARGGFFMAPHGATHARSV
jgi:hypothetical protein